MSKNQNNQNKKEQTSNNQQNRNQQEQSQNSCPTDKQ